MNKFLKSKYLPYIALFLILVGGVLVRLYKIDNPIADWHSWRQVDTASVSLTFVERGYDLLRPKYHDISSIQTGYFNPEGYRFVEFPIYNLLHAASYRIMPLISFEIWGRLISITAAALTTAFLFGLGKRKYGKWVGILAAFFYAFLPYNIYFTRVILPDPMSVMLSVAAVYFFVVFTDSERKWSLFASAITFSLAMLVKPHAIFFAIPVAYLALEKYSIAQIIKNKWFFVCVNVALIPFFLWRIWIYQEGLLRGIAHWEWSFNGNGIRFRPAFWRWIFGERIGKIILGVWGLIPFGYGLIHGKKYVSLVHAFLLGAFLYVSIFATANVMHDYYQLFVVPAVALALAVGAHSIWTNDNFNKITPKLVLLFSVGMMLAMSFYAVKDNYRINDPGIVAAGKEADFLLPRDALVIATYNGDTTFLYQTKRWGWPTVTTSIDEMIEMGADFYISVNSSDMDTVNFKQRFEAVKETDKFIILDLHREKKS